MATGIVLHNFFSIVVSQENDISKMKKNEEETQKALKVILIFKQRKNRNKKYTYPEYAPTPIVFSLSVTVNTALVLINFLRKYFLISCLKQFTLIAVLTLLTSLFQVLGSIYDRLCIPNFDLRKGNFNFSLQERWLLHYCQQAENFIKIVRTLIVVKFKKTDTMNFRYLS